MVIRLTERRLRQIIREELQVNLNEGPLVPDGVLDYDFQISPIPGIGYGKSKIHGYIKKVEEIYSKTKDNWAIVTLADIVHSDVEKKHFKDWLEAKIEKRNIPKDAKILVVFSASMKGDLGAPNWLFAHDVIGHSVGKVYFDRLGFRHGSKGWYEERRFRGRLIRDLHKTLDSSIFQVEDELESKFDKVYDVFAAIVLEYLTEGEAMSIAERGPPDDVEDREELVRDMFRAAHEWMDSIKPGVPTPVRPW